LQNVRKAGNAVTVSTIRASVVANLQHQLPDKLPDFKCSDSWVRKFVFRELKWVLRKPTKASQKVPADAINQITNSFFRHVLTFRDAPIRHPAFQVNMDQTQVVYQMGGGLTFELMGAAQVPVLGLEEKRAFTLVVAVSGLGEVLPFQAIFQGKTSQSTPSTKAPGREEATRLGFLFEYSGTDTYWSNQATMRAWVTHILVPYWRQKMVEVGIPVQECLLQLDAWKVHRSKEFTDWIHTEYPWITLEFVPGGCTGLFQPCDVGIQRPLKLAIKHCQQDDMVKATLAQLQSGVSADEIKFDVSIGVLRDRTVKWLVSAFHQVNKPDVVRQVR
jgi:DDE superfamily endonuclease